MARVAIIDDEAVHASMAAAPLKDAGHETRTFLYPLDWNEFFDYGPQLIVVALYRRKDAFNRKIESSDNDIDGFSALEQLLEYPASQLIPILILADGLFESDLDRGLGGKHVRYDAFVSKPGNLPDYIPTANRLAEKVKTRVKVSEYCCPVCRSRLAFYKLPINDLLCVRCGTSVVVTERDECLYMTPTGEHHPCRLNELVCHGGGA